MFGIENMPGSGGRHYTEPDPGTDTLYILTRSDIKGPVPDWCLWPGSCPECVVHVLATAFWPVFDFVHIGHGLFW